MIQLSRKSVKRVFIFFLIYLPIQYLWIGIAGSVWSEPWPSFALPGFKNIYATEEYGRILKPFFYAEVEGKEESGENVDLEISAFHLFDEIQPSQLQGFFRTHFSEPKNYNTKTKQWLKHQVEQEYPDTEIGGLKVVWKQITYLHSGNSISVHSQKEINVVTISFDD